MLNNKISMVVLEIKVTPKSSRSEILIDDNGKIIVYLKNAPERGKANQELVKLLSNILDIPQFDIAIISGLTSRNKRLKIKADKDFINKKINSYFNLSKK